MTRATVIVMIVCIDGIDFSGKDTLAKELKKSIQDKHHRPIIISAYHHPELLLDQLSDLSNLKTHPDILRYVKYSTLIVNTLKNCDELTTAEKDTVQLLFSSIIPLYKKIIELCNRHQIDVIMPRSWTSSYTYHKGFQKNHKSWVQDFAKQIWPQIDLYVFINLSKEELVKRMNTRVKTPSETILRSYEENIDYLLAVNNSFHQLAPKINALQIEGTLTPVNAVNLIQKELKKRNLLS